MKPSAILTFLSAALLSWLTAGMLRAPVAPEPGNRPAKAPEVSAISPPPSLTMNDLKTLEDPRNFAFSRERLRARLETVPEPEIRALALEFAPLPWTLCGVAAGQVWSRWAELDLSAALENHLKIRDESLRAEAISALLRVMEGRDPAAASRLVLQAPEDSREELRREELALLAARDPRAALRRLQTSMLPAETLRTAAQALAGPLTDADPQAAAAWASTLSSPPLRAETLRAVLTRWRFNDPAAEEAWTAALSEEDRKAVTE